MSWQELEIAYPYRNGKPVQNAPDTTMWMNDLYVVHVRTIAHDEPGQPPMYHLSIRRQDRAAARDWRDFQRIKNQLCGPEYEAVEIYPAESRKVDTANQYHLWAFPFTFGFGLGNERVVSDHALTEELEPGAVQRDNEPVDGPLSTREEMDAWLKKSRR